MRRTTDPGSPALTFDSLPNVFKARSLPLKHSEQYSPDYTNGIRPLDPVRKRHGTGTAPQRGGKRTARRRRLDDGKIAQKPERQG
ncbi:hypothetical protein ACOZEM_31430 [Streptomyces cellulosae]|uniref:hypothetical protein n=1 Tax=Streptomyces sp. MD20-1-1 TaxID=3028668 RepID=UPI00307BAC28